MTSDHADIAASEEERRIIESFENDEGGVFERITNAAGMWTVEAGTAIVDRAHARTGSQCLWLTGGERTTVTLVLPRPTEPGSRLSFHAERWTSRKPFRFQIEARSDDEWRSLYEGADVPIVGRAFRSRIRLPLGDTPVTQIRFTVSSPPRTGVLIDDVRIGPSIPQRVVEAKVVPFTLPLLKSLPVNPLVQIQVTTVGDAEPLSLTKVFAHVNGATSDDDLASLCVTTRDPSGRFEVPAAERWRDLPPDRSDSIVLPTDHRLVDGDNVIWVAGRLTPTADIDRPIVASVKRLRFSNGQTIDIDAPPSKQRLGIALRRAGQDGHHTYRIPGLVTTNAGSLIAVYDVRHRGSGDLPGDIDVGMSRSTDGGRSWDPLRIIMDMGADPKWRYDGIGDPAILVDRVTGTIWVAATWSHGNRSWHGSGPGLTPDETGQLMLTRSDDDGLTWSRPINITKQVKRPEWCFLLQGPGRGITTDDGTLVFAAQYQDTPENNRLPRSTILYSRDRGKTWQVGRGAWDDTTEAQVVEVQPGVLMLNCRYNRSSKRVVMTTRDWGETWTEHPTTRRALIEPGACMASLIDTNVKTQESPKGWLLFSNPHSLRGRQRMTIQASPDRGRTWPAQYSRLLDEGRGYGYSCLTMIDEKMIGIVYEGSRSQLTFQRIPVNELISDGSPNDRKNIGGDN